MERQELLDMMARLQLAGMRAALEGIAFQVADLVAAAARGGLRPLELRADGGAGASDLLLQTQADLVGAPGHHRDAWCCPKHHRRKCY